jgi:hypothetical protein
MSDFDYFDDDGDDELTSEQTMSELDELALRRAASLGRPVLVAGFASSGRARVFDLELPNGAPLDEGEFVPVADVTVTRSPPAT